MSLEDKRPTWSPAAEPKEVWNRLARENAISAQCHHFTTEQFEAAGKRDAEQLLEIMRCAFWYTGSVEPPSETAVLDVGGGTGRIARYLAPKIGSYTLLDVSEEMLLQARERLETIENITFMLGDGHSLCQLTDESVGFILSYQVLQHCDREVTVSYLREIRRVLRTRGAAWLQVPPMRYPERFADCDRGDWPANMRRWYAGEFLEVCARVGLSVLAADCDDIQVLLGKASAPEWLRSEVPSVEKVSAAL